MCMDIDVFREVNYVLFFGCVYIAELNWNETWIWEKVLWLHNVNRFTKSILTHMMMAV
jgi:hypothetical protein